MFAREVELKGFPEELSLATNGAKNEVILQRLENFALDEPGAARPFTKRLAEEQGWTEGFSQKAAKEYLRFIGLAATAPFEVTPSKAVDEVWHLHLTYTKSYWDDLCGTVVGRGIDHNPGTGAPGDEKQYQEQYLKTLALYREVYGEEAPDDVWPRPNKLEKSENETGKKNDNSSSAGDAGVAVAPETDSGGGGWFSWLWGGGSSSSAESSGGGGDSGGSGSDHSPSESGGYSGGDHGSSSDGGFSSADVGGGDSGGSSCSSSSCGASSCGSSCGGGGCGGGGCGGG